MKAVTGILMIATLFAVASCSNKEHEDNVSAKASFVPSGFDKPIPVTISFINNSSNATSYKWSFGDGATSTEINPTHTYTAIGAYTLKLVATGQTGSDSVCKVLYLGDLQTGKSTFSYFMDKCVGIPVNFSFFSLNPQSSAFSWDFGNGAGSLDKNPIIQYSATGTYMVTFSSKINNVRDTAQLGLIIN